MLSPVVTFSAARAYVVDSLLFTTDEHQEIKLILLCRCLFALSPLICPLCRKRFDPSKAKRLHVDRPETVDENREVDLLQRMAISAEAPEDQLQELLNEVDVWLDSRADDTVCVLLVFLKW
jgi:hypothetical protein